MRYVRGGGRAVRAGVSPVARLVDGQLASLHIEAKVREHTAPLIWAEIVGPQVAGATEVLGVSGGVLRVSTKSSVWSNELTFYKKDILRRLNARLGATADSPIITDVLFQNHGLRREKPGALDGPPPLGPTPDELDDIPLSAAEQARIDADVAPIRDAQLRDSVRRARMADLKLRTWRLDSGWIPCPGCGDLTPPHHLTGEAAQGGRLSDACPRCRVIGSSR